VAPGAEGKETVLAISTGPTSPTGKSQKGEPQLWLATNSFAIGTISPGASAVSLFAGESPQPAALASATALLGVTDDDGTLVLVIADGPVGPALRVLLQQLGCSQVLIPPKTLDLRLGGSLDLSGELAKSPLAGPVVTLERAQAPAAKELFPGTPVVDPSVWQPLQARRVRYFGKKPVRPGIVAPSPPAPTSSAN
jgi:hypothetical protein